MRLNANDNDIGRHRPTMFREKVMAYYRNKGISPDFSSLMASHYMAALVGMREVDVDKGPILANCSKFGPEPSARKIVEFHVSSLYPKVKDTEHSGLVERGLEVFLEECRARTHDIDGFRYRRSRYFL